MNLHVHSFMRSFFSLLVSVLWLGLSQHAQAQSPASATGAKEVTQLSQIWIDASGRATIEQIAANVAGSFQPIGQSRNFSLSAGAALWMRVDLPAADASEPAYLQLSSASALDRVSLYQRTGSGAWKEQKAGDRIPVAAWDVPEQTPVFKLAREAATTIWLRLESHPAAVAPRLQLLTQEAFDAQRRWSTLLLGGYFGFGILVLLLGMMHVQLYGERAFVAYSAYVAFMLFFQLSFTGIGGLYFWPHSAAWNNAAPAIFMLLLTATGIWFVREACGLKRYSKFVDKFALAWVAFGVLFSAVYTAVANHTTFAILNVYALLSVALSITLCLWVWRRGERYGFWLFLGFLPVHLGYPFPALRSAGLIADNWLSQYAVLIGSAIEIPLLLYVLHLRAKEFNENRARMRAIDQTDPLTGLAMPTVLALRMLDALRRSRSKNAGQARTLMLVELANHGEIVQKEGGTLGDRALVVAASRIVSAVSDIDTVCRLDNTQFAALIDSPMDSTSVTELAQKIIARGLAEPADRRSSEPLRLRVVTAQLQARQTTPAPDDSVDVNDILAPLVRAMTGLSREPTKAILHLADLRSSASIPGIR